MPSTLSEVNNLAVQRIVRNSRIDYRLIMVASKDVGAAVGLQPDS